MELLLDTHVFLWISAAPENLSETAENKILDHQNQLYLSSVSLWGMQIKAALGRLKLEVSLR